MKIIKYTTLLLTILLVVSCEDFFETTIEIDPPELDKAMAVSAFIGMGEPEAFVSVSRLIGVQEDFFYGDEYPLLDDVDLRILNENSGESIDFEKYFDRYPINYFSQGNEGFFREKNVYRIEAEHPDYPTSFAVDTMPEKVMIDNIVFYEDGGIDEFGDQRSSFEITFQDPPGKNYYEVTVFDSRIDPNGNLRLVSTYTSSTDPSVKRAFNFDSIIVDDETFNGEEKTLLLKFFSQTEERAKEELYVELKSITKSFYDFSKTARAASENEDNPFISPIQIFSNVQGGLGIFGLFASELKKY